MPNTPLLRISLLAKLGFVRTHYTRAIVAIHKETKDLYIHTITVEADDLNRGVDEIDRQWKALFPVQEYEVHYDDPVIIDHWSFLPIHQYRMAYEKPYRIKWHWLNKS